MSMFPRIGPNFRLWLQWGQQQAQEPLVPFQSVPREPKAPRPVYVSPPANYDCSLGVLRGRLAVRLEILRQDERLGAQMAAHSNRLAIAELEKVIRAREEGLAVKPT